MPRCQRNNEANSSSAGNETDGDTLVNSQLESIKESLNNLAPLVGQVSSLTEKFDGLRGEILQSVNVEIEKITTQFTKTQTKQNGEIKKVSNTVKVLQKQLADLEKRLGYGPGISRDGDTEQPDNDLTESVPSLSEPGGNDSREPPPTSSAVSSMNILPFAASNILQKSLPRFNGKEKIHVVDFIADLENYFKLTKADPSTQLCIALSCLDDSAKEWGRSFGRNYNTFSEFKIALQDEY
jgi:hypothetical protein